jgi:hypothetical protein
MIVIVAAGLLYLLPLLCLAIYILPKTSITTGQSEKYIDPSHVYVTDKEKF